MVERRTSGREATSREVLARVPAAHVFATILDLSTTGCMAEVSSAPPPPGTTILLCLSASDEVAGQIVWRNGNAFGVHFHNPIAEETLARLTRPGEAEHSAAPSPSGRGYSRLDAQIRFERA